MDSHVGRRLGFYDDEDDRGGSITLLQTISGSCISGRLVDDLFLGNFRYSRLFDIQPLTRILSTTRCKGGS